MAVSSVPYFSAVPSGPTQAGACVERQTPRIEIEGLRTLTHLDWYGKLCGWALSSIT